MTARTSHRAFEPRSVARSVGISASSDTSRPQPDPAAERLAYSVNEAARLTGLSRDLLYDQMRQGNLDYIKIGRRRLITRRHLEQFLDIAPSTGRLSGINVEAHTAGPDAP